MATFFVTTLDDDNDSESLGGPYTNGLSLREALTLASSFSPGADVIRFDPLLSGGTITLSGTALTNFGDDIAIEGDIDGNGTPDITIDGNAASQIFFVNTGKLIIEGLVLTNGAGVFGGAIGISSAGSVDISRSEIIGNTAVGSGGGIANFGTLTISESVIASNTAPSASGQGGGLDNTGTLTLTNVSVVGNTANISSGGLFISSGTVTIINSTITGNYSPGPGDELTNFGTLSIFNSIILGDGGDTAFAVAPTAIAFSLIGGLTVATPADVFAAVDGATGGGLLANNGGGIRTVALKNDAANPALDAGDDSLAPAADARGIARVDYPSVANNGLNLSDLGAFELQFPEARSLVVTTLDDVVDQYDGLTSLREAIAFANDPTAGALADGDADDDGNANDTITFDPALSAGGTITLVGGQLAITAPVTIDNGATPDIVIDADGLSRVILAAADLTLQGLSITGGQAAGVGGGVRMLGVAALTVTDSVITGNRTTGSDSFGGGIYSDGGAITLTNATVRDNSTTGSGSGGGGIFSFFGAMSLTNSTVSGNSTSGNNSEGGGIYSFSGAISLTNSTVAGNSTSGEYSFGGGIFNLNGLTTLTNSTVTGNSTSGDGSEGGGIFNFNEEVTLTNSIVLGNATTFAGVGYDEIRGSVTQTGPNIIGQFHPATPADVFAAIDGTTGGGLLADNGGPVKTVALKNDPANPALDAGDDSLAPTADARGTARVDYPGVANNGLNLSDLGAFELVPPEARSLVVTTLDDVVEQYDGLTSLREAIAFANDPTAGALADGDADDDGNANDTITFDPALSGGTIALSSIIGPLAITAPITIDGDIDDDHTPDITIDAQQNFGVIRTQANTTLIGLTITGGAGPEGNGVRAMGSASLTIEDSVITGNNVSGPGQEGGGILSGHGAITLTNTTVSANSTLANAANGGGIASNTGAITLTDSTVSGNETKGNGARGGGIYSYSGKITLANSTVSGNSTKGNVGEGGGIATYSGALSLSNSTISGNSTAGQSSSGGGLYSNRGEIALINSTVSGNSTLGLYAKGGGIWSDNVRLTNSTVSGNSTAGGYANGGGIFGATSITLINSLVVGNVAKGVAADNETGGVSPAITNSIVSGSVADLFASTYTITGTSVLAGVLADNGGPVQTIALKNDPANPALDAGDDSLAPTTDARGLARFDVPSLTNNGANFSDLGAFELVGDSGADTPSVTNAETDEDVQTTSGLVISRNLLDGAEVTHFKITNITNGTLFLNDGVTPIANNSFITFAHANAGLKFTPAPDFFGIGSFDVQASLSDSDAGLGGAVVTAQITVNDVIDVIGNFPPDAVDDTVTALANTTTVFPAALLLANDSDFEGNPFVIVDVFGAIGGTAVGQNGGSVLFTPAFGFVGPASFRYTIGDSFGGQDTAEVTVNVIPNSQPGFPSTPGTPGTSGSPPVAPAVNLVRTIENFASGPVVIGATDPDGDIASYVIRSGAGPLKGSVGFAGGTFVYTPLANAEGADAFTIRIADSGGRFVDQVVSVQIVPLPSASDWRYLADDGERVTLGGKGQVFATTGVQEIVIAPVAGMVSLDGSFNAGGDVVRLTGAAANWLIVRSGTSAILSDGSSFVQIPAGPAGLTIAFDDGLRSFRIDTESASLKIGAQTITASATPVTASAQALTLPTGIDPDARGLLLMNEQGAAVVNGKMQVFGTLAQGERLTLLGGEITFDGSFNAGGDVIEFTGPAPTFSARVSGSAVVVEKAGLLAQIPFGTAETSLAFTDETHALSFDGAASVTIGDQIITGMAAPLTFA